MYIDLIVLAVLIVFVVIYSKRLQTYLFGFGMIDVLFRILNVIDGYIPSGSLKEFVDSYIPSSIPGVISKYTNGTIEMVLCFIYAIIMAMFLYFVVKIFIKRKKI